MPRWFAILVLFATSLGAIGLNRAPSAIAGIVAQDEVCDVAADSALGREDYPQAIKLHQRIVAAHADDALAHYHLGFAYGMVGRRDEELAEYRRAAALGLPQWDLYLNLGRSYLESGEYRSATDVLLTAVKSGSNHPEAHFNLGLAYERQAMLPQAEQEMRRALSLGANPADAGNMLAVIYAEEGDRTQARRIWTGLMNSPSAAEVARSNLAVLDRAEHSTHPASLTATRVAYSESHP